MPPTDRELTDRFLGGDALAFDELVRRHERRVYNLCLRMLERPEDARDATQDAFFAVLRKLPSFRGDAAFTTWLHRVAVNACYDILRKRKRRAEDSFPDEARISPTDDIAEATSEAVDVRRALALVPDEFRAVLVLHDVQDLPYDRIAEILDVPIGTVKSRLHRGRVALGRLLQGTSGPPGASEGKMEP